MSLLGSLLKRAAGPKFAPLGLANPFNHLDLEETARSLRIDEMAVENGKLELPGTTTRSLDETENSIISAVQNHVRQAREEARAEIRTFDDRLAQLELLSQLSSIGTEARTAEAEFKASIVESRNRLALSANKVAESFQALRQFKKLHGLERPANRPAAQIVLWGGLLLALLVEASLNTVFLRVNDDMGLLGGFLAAIVVAAVNISVAYVAGRFVWSGWNHRSGGRRALAMLLTTAWMAFVIVWNFLAAHFRDAKSDGATSPETTALASFLSAPFALENFYSWGLLIMGFLFAALAALAAYRLDDPYPGYGAIDKAHTERCDDYAADVTECVDRLREIFDTASTEVKDVQRVLGQQFRESLQAKNARETMITNCDQHIDYLVQCANSLLSRYRRGNLTARSTPAPTTFDQKWSLAPQDYLRPSVPPIDLPATQADVAAADKALEDAIGRISAAFEAALHNFDTLEQLKAKFADG